MSLIKCPECGKEISNQSQNCPNCGYPMRNNKFKNGWALTRKIIGTIDAIIMFFFFMAINQSEGGLLGNTRIAGITWIFACSAILNCIFFKKKWATITSVVFYSFGIIANFFFSARNVSHLYLMVIMIVFLIINCVSLSKKESFS